MKFIQCRVVGNELPPRDLKNSKLDCLQWIVQYGNLSGVDNLWVINHIIDEDYRTKVLKILKNESIIEMKFDPELYKKAQNKITYAININAARNYGIKTAQKHADFVISLDQDCYFKQEEWNKIKENIVNSNKQYYCVNSVRVHITNIPHSLEQLEKGEEMPIFRKDASLYFDETIPFGQADKIKLLEKINGFNIGCARHMAFGDEIIEKDGGYRCQIRETSIKAFIAQLETHYAINVPIRHIVM